MTPPGTRRRLSIARLFKRKLSLGQLIANKITDYCGSLPFVWFHTTWFLLWIMVNMYAPVRWRFDPFPFGLLTLIVSLEAIFLSTFIMISQNLQSIKDREMAQHDFDIDVKAEIEIEAILNQLTRQEKSTVEILDRLERLLDRR